MATTRKTSPSARQPRTAARKNTARRTPATARRGSGTTAKAAAGHVTPREFAVVLGTVIALFASVISLLTLLTSYVDFLLPDPLAYQYGMSPYSSGVLVSMAFLIVVVPVYLLLSRELNREARANPTVREHWVRKWAFTGTMFVGAIAVVITLIVLLASFLQGDLTARFLLKMLAIVLVVGGFVAYYWYDLRGHWQKQPEQSRALGWAVGVIVAVTVISGFVIVGTPGELRAYRADDRRVSDLQQIQWGVVDYFQTHESLPTSLTVMASPYFGGNLPSDPETEEPYTYVVTGDLTFQLCATFNKETWNSETADLPVGVGSFDNWNHPAGDFCYDRTIDPAKYPPYSKG